MAQVADISEIQEALEEEENEEEIIINTEPDIENLDQIEEKSEKTMGQFIMTNINARPNSVMSNLLTSRNTPYEKNEEF